MAVVDPFGWVGRIIDDQFAVESVAGEGGFGVVYRGVHLGFDAPIAVKCLKIPGHVDEKQREAIIASFRSEAKVLYRLSRLTSGVVQALHVGAAAAPSGVWTPYIVMEWLEGETLESDLARRAAGAGRRSLDEAIELLSPAAGALAIAHRERVSHRDVKPANLFLVRDQSGARLKVVDFGIAKIFAEIISLSAILARTDSAFRACTPQYAAPEQFAPRYGATGPWTDVFAMALVLIEVASGRLALEGSDPLQLCISATDEDRRPGLIARGVSASTALEAVVQRALAVSPALRYADLGEMWAAVKEAQAASRSAAVSAPTAVGVGAVGGAGSPASPGALMPTASLPALPAPALTGATAPLPAPASTGALMSTASLPAPASLASSAPASAGRNRVCTVMFVDLSGAIGLAARADGETAKALLDRAARAAREHVAAMGGIVQDQAGDRVIATFGLPRATDGDAERAVTAALAVQAAIARIPLPRALRPTTRLAARIGISTGRVFAESLVDPVHGRLCLVGDALHIAGRLQQTAPEGAIAIGRDTYRQVANRFNVEPLPPIEVAGDVLPSYRVVGRSPYRHGLRSSDFHGLEPALVGRGSERQRLIDALETVLSESRAKLVTLVGPPGVGRSQLLADFYASVAMRPETVFVITAQGSPLEQDTSYALAASLIRRRFEVHEDDAPEVVRRKLLRGVRWLRLARKRRDAERDPEGADLDDDLRQIALLLGAQPAAGETAPLSHDDASTFARHRIVAAVMRLLAMVGSRLPIVCLCDDLHGADAASLDLLDALLARAEEIPLLVVVSTRPELFEARPGWGEGRAQHERIDVAPLPRRHIEEMIRDRLRLVADLSPDVVKALADRAEGSPLTLVEMLHLLIDAGAVQISREGGWRVQEERFGWLSLPTTVQGIVQARLDRLDPEALDLLERAAIVGRTFWEGAVDGLRREGGHGAGPGTGALLARLRKRQFVRAREPSTFPEEQEYVFAESATYEVASEMLSTTVRRALHLFVASWLETRQRGRAGAALLALHYDRGGMFARAGAEYAKAGAHAAALGENAEALRHLERARQIHEESDGAEPADDGLDVASPERRVADWTARVRLRIELGDVLRRIGRLEDAERAYGEARARILRRERRPMAEHDPAATALWEARVDFRLAQVERLRGALAEARALCERAIRRAIEANAARETPSMYALLAFIYRRERRPDASLRAALDGLRACRAIDRSDPRWSEDVAQLLFGIASPLYGRGRFVSGERCYRQALRVLNEAQQPHLAGVALNGIAVGRGERGDFKASRELFARSLRLKERVGDLHQIAVACSNLAEISLLLGDVPAALEYARRGVHLGEQTRAGYDLAECYRNLGEASLAAGDFVVALDAGLKAVAIAETTGRVYLGSAAVALARTCARAAEESPSGSALRARAVEAANALERSLARYALRGQRSAGQGRRVSRSPGTNIVEYLVR